MWFWYALLSALLSAISVFINKSVLKNVHARLLSWSLFFFSIPVLLILVLREGNISFNRHFLISATVSAISFSIAKTLTLDSIKNGVISKIYPLVSLGPIFTYIFGIIFLSEQIRSTGVLGLLFIVIGLYILNIEQAHEGMLKPFKFLIADRISLIFILGILLSSVTTVFDKIAILNTNPNSQTFTLLFENIIMSILLFGYLTHKDKKWLVEVKSNFLSLFFASIFYMIMAIVIFLGFTSGPVALIIGVKKLEVIFVLIISYFLFGERPAKNSWLAAIVMIFGVVLIRFS